MPSRNEHLAVVRDNLECLKRVCCDEYQSPAWATTVIFYSGLHVVNCVFEGLGHLHETDHKGRNAKLKRDNRFRKIWRHYKPLWQDSLVARYLSSDEAGTVSSFGDYMSASKVVEVHLNHNFKQILASAEKLLGTPLDVEIPKGVLSPQ